jgi:tripeptidyl-peptidase-1
MTLKYTIGLATGVPVTFISAGDDNPDGASGFLQVSLTLLCKSLLLTFPKQ